MSNSVSEIMAMIDWHAKVCRQCTNQGAPGTMGERLAQIVEAAERIKQLARQCERQESDSRAAEPEDGAV